MKVFIIGLVATSWLLCFTAQAQHSTPTDDQLVTPAQKQQRATDAKATKSAQKQPTNAGKHQLHAQEGQAREPQSQPNEQRTTGQSGEVIDKAAHRAMRADKKRARSTMQ